MLGLVFSYNLHVIEIGGRAAGPFRCFYIRNAQLIEDHRVFGKKRVSPVIIYSPALENHSTAQDLHSKGYCLEYLVLLN
jgi:hypothetical protein